MSNRRKRLDTTSRSKTAGARSPAERLEPGRAPVRPRGLQTREPSRLVSGTVRVFSALITLSLVTMLVMSGVGLTVYHQYETPGPLESQRTVIIPKGEGRIAIAERLEKEGIISNRWTFIGGHLLQSWFGSTKMPELRAGEYELKAYASMREVMDTLAEGKSILYKVTMPEGLTSQQIVERLKAEPTLSGDVATIPPEGTLLPDTYHFSKGASRQEIVEHMQLAMKKYVTALWEKRASDLPLRSPEDAVTFASIVEKETGKSDERDRVAAVFYNRLKKGMRLQSDPTIIYGIAGGAGTLGRGITKADIDSKTPYNTYQINGLPPGPIANPGKAALEASFKPAKTSDLYFVANGTGGHAFSETLKEHNSAVAKWRDTEKQAKAAQPPSKDPGAQNAEPDPDVAPIPDSAIDIAPEPPAAAETQKPAKTKPKPSASTDKAKAAPPAGDAPAQGATVAPASTSAASTPAKKPKNP